MRPFLLMNNARVLPVRMAALAIACWAFAPVRAQDPSLTKEFPNLSSKERSRIAAKETNEAAQDEVYQTVMREAEVAFQQGKYEEALAGYEKARTQRPYNVYPKVKIQDLQALLKRKEAEQHAADPQPPPPNTSATPGNRVVDASPPALGTKPEAPPTPVATPPAPQESPKPAAAPKTTAAPAERPSSTPVKAKEPAPLTRPREAPAADGAMEERRYQQGQAFVIERTITVEGRRVIYKRVQHPFGQVYFFEDGVPVDERVWSTRFQGQ